MCIKYDLVLIINWNFISQFQDVSLSSWSNRVLQDGITGSDITTGSDRAIGIDRGNIADPPHNAPGQTHRWSVSGDSYHSEEIAEHQEPWEGLGLLVTDREVRVLSKPEAQTIIRERGDEVQTMTLPVQTTDESGSIHDIPDLSRTPLVLLFREPVRISEAYCLLLALLETDREADPAGPRASEPQSSSRARLPHRDLGPLKEVVKLGVRTGQRTLEVPLAAGTESVEADLPEPGVSEPSQAQAGQFRRSQGEDIRSSTYRRLGSLEETIRELETALQEFGVHPSTPIGTPVSTTTPSSNKTRPPVPPKPKPKPSTTKVLPPKNPPFPFCFCAALPSLDPHLPASSDRPASNLSAPNTRD